MIANSTLVSSNFKVVARGLVALHRLIKDDKDDSLEGEAIRDALDAPLKALSQIERERSRQLSEDLYRLNERAGATAQNTNVKSAKRTTQQ